MSPVPVMSALEHNCVPPERAPSLRPFLSAAVATSLPPVWPSRARLRSPALRNEHHACLPGHAPSLPNEFSSLRGRSFAFSRVFLSSFKRFLFRHRNLLLNFIA